MSWQTELVELTRLLLGDLDGTAYSDHNIQRLVVGAAMFVSQDAEFTQDFSADLENLDITPDPTDSVNDTRDVAFMNLTAIKAACIVNRGDVWRTTGRGILIKDIGALTIDKREAAKNKIALLLKGGWCPVYDTELKAHLRGTAEVAGAAIMGPFRTIAGYGPSYYDERSNFPYQP